MPRFQVLVWGATLTVAWKPPSATHRLYEIRWVAEPARAWVSASMGSIWSEALHGDADVVPAARLPEPRPDPLLRRGGVHGADVREVLGVEVDGALRVRLDGLAVARELGVDHLDPQDVGQGVDHVHLP